jgi:hypothetical protein
VGLLIGHDTGLCPAELGAQLRVAVFTIWHEVLHWGGLLVAVYVVSLLISIGLMSRFLAGLQVLSLLALATFLAIYIEPTFILTGIVLGLFVVAIAFIKEYMFGILLLGIAIAAVLTFWVSRRKHKKKSPELQASS